MRGKKGKKKWMELAMDMVQMIFRDWGCGQTQMIWSGGTTITISTIRIGIGIMSIIMARMNLIIIGGIKTIGMTQQIIMPNLMANIINIMILMRIIVEWIPITRNNCSKKSGGMILMKENSCV